LRPTCRPAPSFSLLGSAASGKPPSPAGRPTTIAWTRGCGVGESASSTINSRQDGGRRHAGPLQRRRDAFAVGRVAVGNRRMIGEGQAAHRDRGHAGAQVDGLKGGLFQTGSLAAQRMAEHVGQFF
jgi:hypothetical protein